MILFSESNNAKIVVEMNFFFNFWKATCVTTQEEHSLYILTESSRQDTGQKYQTA